MQATSGQSRDGAEVLAQAATLAGVTVAIIRHSGWRGTHKEFAALVAGLEAAAVRYPANPLVQDLLSAETRDQIARLAREYRTAPKKSTVQDFKMAALNRCAQAADWLDQNARPQEAAEVKESILTTCRSVAEESKEGGILGFGGTEVDPFEDGVIQEIARTLRA